MYVYRSVKQLAEHLKVDRRTANKRKDKLEKVYRINNAWQDIFIGYALPTKRITVERISFE